MDGADSRERRNTARARSWPSAGVVVNSTSADSGMVGRPDSGMVGRPDSGMVGRPDSGMVGRPDSGMVGRPDSGKSGCNEGQPSCVLSLVCSERRIPIRTMSS